MSSLYRAAGIVLVLNLASKILGFVRDATLAGYFGASAATDAYMVAYTLPYSLQAVLGMAFLTVMVPLFAGSPDREHAYRVADGVVHRVGRILVVLVVGAILLAGPLTRLLAPGFDPETARTAAALMRIMLPSLLFMGLGMLFSGILNGEKRFALAASGPGLINVVVIAGILTLGRPLGIRGVALATLLGFAGYFLLLLWGVRRQGFSPTLGPHRSDPAVRGVLASILPVALSVSVSQVLLAVSRFFASGLDPGSISALDYANRIMNLPLGILAAAVVTATFPLLSEGAQGDQGEVFSRTFRKGFQTIAFFVIPVSFGMMVLREPLVRVLYQRGAFGPAATATTSQVLFFFSLALAGFAANMMMTRAFYARREYRFPLRCGLGAVGIHIALSAVLSGRYGLSGLAASNAVAAYAYAGLLALGLQRKVSGTEARRLGGALLRYLTGGLLMGWMVLSLRGFLENFPGTEPGYSLGLLASGTALGLVVYLLALRVLGAGELREMWDSIRGKGESGHDG